MAEPKKKLTRTRTGHRRHQWKLKIKSLSICPNCKQSKLPHQVCPNCGYFKGEKILTLK